MTIEINFDTTDSDYFTEWHPHEFNVTVDFIPGIPESHAYYGSESYDEGTDDQFTIEKIENITDDWFAGKDIKDLMRVNQQIALEKHCVDQISKMSKGHLYDHEY